MSNKPIRVAIVGKTGAGKTSFISRALGLDDNNTVYKVGHGIDSCTKSLQPARVVVDGKSVELLDTPGFDDSDQDDGRTFIDFAQLLGSSSRTDKLLNGVIYMEPVEGPRVGDSERKRLDLIKNILGAQFMDRTAIVTSTWDLGITAKRQVWEDGRVQSEAVWGGMLGPGKATLIHFENTQESATEIIRHFLDSEKFSPCPVLLQTELARNGEKLSDTSAGRLLHVIVSEEVETIKQQISFTGGTKKLEEAVQQKQSFLKRLAEVVIQVIKEVWCGANKFITGIGAESLLDNTCKQM